MKVEEPKSKFVIAWNEYRKALFVYDMYKESDPSMSVTNDIERVAVYAINYHPHLIPYLEKGDLYFVVNNTERKYDIWKIEAEADKEITQFTIKATCLRADLKNSEAVELQLNNIRNGTTENPELPPEGAGGTDERPNTTLAGDNNPA